MEAAKRGEAEYGNISSEEELLKNMAQNCIPTNITEMDYSHYDEFLATRRKLMAEKIREYYHSLGA